MLVVKKSFRSLGKFYDVGSVITDPTSVKLLKSKINFGKIIVLEKATRGLDAIILRLEAKAGRPLKEELLLLLDEEATLTEPPVTEPPVTEPPVATAKQAPKQASVVKITKSIK